MNRWTQDLPQLTALHSRRAGAKERPAAPILPPPSPLLSSRLGRAEPPTTRAPTPLGPLFRRRPPRAHAIRDATNDGQRFG